MTEADLNGSDSGIGRAMTVERLRELLAPWPGDLEVVVHASDGDIEVFAALKDAGVDATCAGPPVMRLFADQEGDDAR